MNISNSLYKRESSSAVADFNMVDKMVAEAAEEAE
jgi:hypothetical protein